MKKLISMFLILSFVLPSFCQTDDIEKILQDTQKIVQQQQKELVRKQVNFQITKWLIGLTMISIGIWDIQEHTVPSYICGGTFALTGVGIIIKF